MTKKHGKTTGFIGAVESVPGLRPILRGLLLAALLSFGSAHAAPAFVQTNNAVPQSPVSTVSASYTAAQTAGNLNVVIIGWFNTTSSVVSVTDSRGHVYTRAVGPTTQAQAGTQSIYYAAGIGASAAGTNTVTVTFSGTVPYPDLRIAEYSGIDAASPVDVVATGTGTSATASTGAVTTTNANDLLVAGTYVSTSTTGPGTGFTQRVITNPDGSILEDRIVTATGSYSATAPIQSGNWIMQMVAFRAGSGGGGDTIAPTAPGSLSGTAVSSTRIDLGWVASTDNVAVTGYLLERCQGAGCSNFAQVATPSGTTYSDTGLTASTSYSYRVRARDAANNLSGYSGTATATTQASPDTSPPTAPSGLTPAVISSTQINLSWTGSTDDVGVTAYLLERCQGVGCTSFAQIATPSGTTYNDTTLSPSTSYSYQVRARDAANNQSGYSNTASATTQTATDTSPPTVPSGLTGTPISSTQINLSWTGSTDDVGVTGYLLERCQGAGCSNFAQIATPSGTTYNDMTLSPSTSYSYRVQARDAANNLSGYSNTAVAITQSPPDAEAPTAPSGLSGTAVSSSQINLSWNASTDNVAVTAYLLERCQGAGCSNFAQVATPSGTTYNDPGLAASTSYSYRVRARDAANNQSGYSNTASATTQAGAAPITYRQSNYSVPQSPVSTVSASYTAAQTAGNLNVVIIGWSNTTSSVVSVTDSRGHVYTRAVGPTQAAGDTQSIYYAAGIGASAAGTNTVTVTFSGTVPWPDLRIAEYSGIDAASPVDVFAAAAGSGTSSNSGAVTTTNANDLLVGGNYVSSVTTGGGASYTTRLITSPNGSILEDRIVTATGSYSATAPIQSGNWIMQMVAFRAGSGGGGDTIAPTAPGSLSGTAVSSTRIDLGWVASTDNVAVTGYLLERCQGAGCSNFAQVATPSGTTYSDTGLTASTSYSYRVRARDAANNTSGYSGTATATTQASPDTSPPTAPSGLTPAVISSTQINLSWTGSTDDVGVTAYLLERCQGVGCTSFAQIATPSGTTYNDTTLSPSTSYSYQVRARDAANNQSGYSNTASATTQTAVDTGPPTVPSGLTGTPISSTQINLSWTASTDDVGVTGYLLERCQGAGCSNFAQIATPSGTTYNDMTLSPSTSYSYRVQARDAANNLSGYSNTAVAITQSPPDAEAPTAPSGLSGTAVSSSQINLSWNASTDNVAVTAYLLERCQGAGCSNFAQVATPSGTTYNDPGLAASTSYSYRVRARDAANNQSGYSNTASATTPAAPAAPAYRQSNYSVPQSPVSTVSATYLAAQTAGNLNVVMIGWSNTTSSVVSVTDSRGHVYTRAVGPTQAAGDTQSIYYAAGIGASAAGTNTVTVTFSGTVPWPDLRIAEYSGIDAASPVDVFAAAAGSGTSSNSGAVTTTNANDLLVGGNYVSSVTTGGGASYTTRLITSPNGSILEDRIVTATGSYSATAPIQSGNWIMQMVAFRAGSGGGGDTIAPTAPGSLSGTAVSSTRIDLGWVASTDNVAVTGYLLERCQGAGCSNFAQVATPSGTTYSDTGLTASTSYSYRVRARDAANNMSGYSGTATATTQASPDTSPPTAPSGLTPAVISSTQINLSWTGSTDDVGVTAYLLERCQGVGCTSFAQIATPSGTTYNDTTLSPSTSYSYQVRARDAANNQSGYSNTASATTQTATDTSPPTVPSGLTGTPISSTQINLSWTASTDDVGVTGYLLERCQGAGCSNFAQIATPSGTTFGDTGLSPSTSYSYRVQARDAANNLSGYSNTAVAITQSPPDAEAPTAPSGLSGTAVSSSQINLSWNASTDNVAVTAYLLERCQGAGCSNFAQVATPSGTTYNDPGLAASTSYSYRVRARDAANNQSGYSNTASATTQAGAAPITYRQSNYSVPQSPVSTVSASYTAAQTAGNLNVVIIGWSNTTSSVVSVTDSRGHVYTRAVGPTQAAGDTQSIYYAAGIGASAAGTNTVTVTFSGTVPWPDLRIAEYSGIDAASPVDVFAAAAGSGTSSNSGAVTTTNANDLLVGGNYVSSVTTGGGASYTTRLITSPNGSILEDRIVTATGSYSATAPIQSGNWIMQMVAFRGGPPGPPDLTPPSISMVGPPPGAVLNGNVTLSASVTDNQSVGGVQFQIDGLNVGVPVTLAPYSLVFNTALLGNGGHALSAYAWDGAKNVGTSAPVTVTFNNASPGNPAQTGLWSGLISWPLVAVHLNLLTDGRVLAWDRMNSGNVDPQIWDPVTGIMTAVPTGDPLNLFCAGQVTLPDGRLFVAGGHIADHVGPKGTRIFDPATNVWTPGADMTYGRWYPTVTTLPDGRILTLSGEVNCQHCYATVPEVYDPQADAWTPLSSASFAWAWYPHAYVIPDGRVVVAATTEAPVATRVLNLATNTWSVVDSSVLDAYSSAMYLPGKILKTGTATDSDDNRPSAARAYVLDMTAASPKWRQVSSMAFPRAYHVETMLPDGTVLVTGGGRTTGDYDIANAVYQAELWSPEGETFTTLSSMHAPRLYHGTAILLADGRVLVAGGGRSPGPDARDQLNAEVFTPPYLFKGARPTISGAPTQLQYNASFTVDTPDAAAIAAVTLVAVSNMTHGLNMNQRFLPLAFTAAGGALTVTAPANGNLAPPGYYLLFIVNGAGVPSVAATVHF